VLRAAVAKLLAAPVVPIAVFTAVAVYGVLKVSARVAFGG